MFDLERVRPEPPDKGISRPHPVFTENRSALLVLGNNLTIQPRSDKFKLLKLGDDRSQSVCPVVAIAGEKRNALADPRGKAVPVKFDFVVRIPTWGSADQRNGLG